MNMHTLVYTSNMSIHKYINFHMTMYRAYITNWPRGVRYLCIYSAYEPCLQWLWATAFQTGRAFQMGRAFQICNGRFLPGTVTLFVIAFI